jgi:hypothetical protein
LSEAISELNAAQAHLAQRLPVKAELRAALVPLQQQITGRSRVGLERPTSVSSIRITFKR